jgi:hypothetical protein
MLHAMTPVCAAVWTQTVSVVFYVADMCIHTACITHMHVGICMHVCIFVLMQQRRALNHSASSKAPKRTNRDIIRGIESSFCNDNIQQEAAAEVQELEEEQEPHPSEVTFTIFEDENETVSKSNGSSNGAAAGGHKRAAAVGNKEHSCIHLFYHLRCFTKFNSPV